MLTPLSLTPRIDAGLTVMLNERPVPWREGLSAAALLAEQGQPAEKVATALNGEFLPSAAREHTRLQPGDELTVFRAIVGG